MGGITATDGIPFNECFSDSIPFTDFLKDEIKEKGEISLNNRFYYITKKKIVHKSGNISGTVLVLHDITEIKRKEEEITAINLQLVNANEVKDFLFKIVSHDLKGPIGNISTMMNFFLEHYSDEQGFRKELQVLYKASTDIYYLLENLLHWANSQQNEIRLQPEYHFLVTTLSQACDVVQYQASEKGISFKISCDDTIQAFYDATTIEIAIRNILSNAIKFSHNNTNIDIVTEVVEKFVLIRVADKGIGMAEKTILRIQNDLIVNPQPGTMKEKGTGIGLHLCISLVKANRGEMLLDSQLNKGTTVTVMLPVKMI